MADYVCYLITVLYEGELMRCALSIQHGVLNHDWRDYPMEHKEEFHKLLPLHVKSCGPIVEIEEIFEVAIVKKDRGTEHE